jgi:hypothetical protein
MEHEVHIGDFFLQRNGWLCKVVGVEGEQVSYHQYIGPGQKTAIGCCCKKTVFLLRQREQITQEKARQLIPDMDVQEAALLAKEKKLAHLTSLHREHAGRWVEPYDTVKARRE